MKTLPDGYLYEVDPRGWTRIVPATEANKPHHEYFTSKADANSAAAFYLKLFLLHVKLEVEE